MKNPVVQGFFSWYRNTIRNPKYRWLIILGTFAYLISPIDISPDLVPILGQIDDTALIMLLLSEVYQLSMEWAKSRQTTADISDSPTEDDQPFPTENSTTPETPTVDVKAVSMD
jgi:uncharacterized membrane protein YkvA (DUF1232 family)